MISGLKADYGSIPIEASGDIWYVLIDKSEVEACDEVNLISRGE
jgi:hypothetical protein